MIKIAFTMIHYPVAMGRYFLEALLRRKDVEVWSAGPFSGRNIPWSDGSGSIGMVMPPAYIRKPDYPLPMSARPFLSYRILEQNAPWKPDLWLEVNANLFPVDVPKGAPYAVVGTDPHVLNPHYDTLRPLADKFFCMQQPYMKNGDVWLPYAYDPVFHSQTTIPYGLREYDASLIGLQYGQRTVFFNKLKQMGHNVYFTIGQAYEDAKKIYHNTRVGFNYSSLQDTTARVFEIMGFGICPLLNNVPDLLEMFVEDEHYLGFSTPEMAIEKFKWAIDNPDKADEMGFAARRAVEPHTWDARAQSILEEMGLVERKGNQNGTSK